MTQCTECGKEEDCRPYGENYAMICYDCGTATPEAHARSKRNFLSQLNAVKGPALIGTEAGPIPANLGMRSVIVS